MKAARIARICLGLLAVYAGLCLVVFFLQRSLIYFPTKADPDRLESTIELQVPGATLRISAREREGPDAVLYFGGNAEDVALRLGTFATEFPGHAIYLMHYRGYGGSTGRPSEDALHADAQVLYDRVRADHPNVVVVGRSLGSGIAVRLAANNPVTRLVLVTPFDSLVSVASAQFPYLPVGWLLKDRYESWRIAPRVGAPTSLVAAENDEVVPLASTMALFSAFAPDVAKLTIIPGVDHNSISGHPDYMPAVVGHGKRGLDLHDRKSS